MFDTGASGGVIAAANAAGRAALVGYLPLGFPDIATTMLAAERLADAADLLLIGLPTTDPSCDGSRISRANLRACARGVDTADLTDAIAALAVRRPVLVLAYWHEIARLGPAGFCRELAHAGCAGIVTPDLAAEHAGAWVAATDRHHLDRVLPALPSMPAEKLALVAGRSRGWVYVPVIGFDHDPADAVATVGRLRAAHPDALVGLDVLDDAPDAASRTAALGDAVVAGTTLVEALPDHATRDLDALGARADALAAGLAR